MFSLRVQAQQIPLSSGGCNTYEECLRKFGAATLLAGQVSEVTKRVFEDNWRLIMDEMNNKMNEAERVRGVDCADAATLVYAPPESPLGRVLQDHFKAISKITGRKLTYAFERDLAPIRDIASGKPSYGVLYKGAVTQEEAKRLFEEQAKWELSQGARLKVQQDAFLNAFKANCKTSNLPLMIEARQKLLRQNRELRKMETSLAKVQEECQGIYQFRDLASGRYGVNKASEGKFDVLKDVAVGVCQPADAIGYLVADARSACSQYVQDVWEIVNPECEKRETVNGGNNLCNGLHRYLTKVFLEHPEYDQYVRDFGKLMKEQKESGGKRDLLDLALDATHGDRLAAVRVLSLVGHDEINTTMKSIREELLKSQQFDRLAKAQDVYTRERHVFMATDDRYSEKERMESGNMTLFKDLIRSGSTVGGERLTGRYYHFVGGMELSCELRAKGYGAFASRNAGSVTGTIYEAYDFKAHITHGVGLGDSITNFNRDTEKHDRGAILGSTFCLN